MPNAKIVFQFLFFSFFYPKDNFGFMACEIPSQNPANDAMWASNQQRQKIC